GYVFSISGAQSRVYAVFSDRAGGVSVKLYSPVSAWISDEEAICSLRDSKCGKAVEFTDLSFQLPLEFRQSFYSNPGSTESGQLIKIVGDGPRLQFMLRKGGYAREQQEYNGYLDAQLL
ncbi:MAG TPA: hypothetical protein PLL10_06430, partial [Elusimicrobiales bacterium]|nr:hypothetical protein [Elusimicrobiales bacterium]